MRKRILIGTVEFEKDAEMYNLEFQYAASFEELKIEKGQYPIFTYEDDVRTLKDGTREIDSAFIGYEGTVISGNVGGKPGDSTTYNQYHRGYSLADDFLKGHKYSTHYGSRYFVLRPEWEIKIYDFVSDYDNRRVFLLGIVLKDDAEYTYMD